MVNTLGSKSVYLAYNNQVFEAVVRSNMCHDEIYTSLRSAVYDAVEPSHIIISDPQRGEKVHLDYDTLRGDCLYDITLCDVYSHGANSASTGAQKAQVNLSIVMQHWKLDNVANVLPHELAPSEWSRSFTESLRKLSFRSQGHRDRAVEWLAAELALRHSRSEGSDRAELMVSEVKRGDVESVVRKWDAQLSMISSAQAQAQQIALEATEKLEEDESNALFGGGLLDALPKVEDEPSYQVGKAFSIVQR